MQLSTFTDLESLEAEFTKWFNADFLPGFKQHGEKVSMPIPKEQMHWRSVAVEATDALTWSKDLEALANDFEEQALGIATEHLTVAQARGKCHKFIRVHKALKRLSESADRKLSALQSLLRV